MAVQVHCNSPYLYSGLFINSLIRQLLQYFFSKIRRFQNRNRKKYIEKNDFEEYDLVQLSDEIKIPWPHLYI